MQHLIQKQILDIRLLENNEPRKQQQAIQSLYWDQILPALNQTLSTIIPADQMLRLDALEVDLGIVAFKDLEQIFVDGVANAIKKEWVEAQRNNSRSLRPAHIGTQKSADQEALFFFLTNGIFPWWYAAQKKNTPVVLWNKIVQQAAQPLVSFLQSEAIPSSNLQKRLSLQFDSIAIEKLLKSIYPEEKIVLENLQHFLLQLPKIALQKVNENNAVQKFRQQLLGSKGTALLKKVTIQRLIQKPLSETSGKSILLEAFLQDIAVQSNLTPANIQAVFFTILKNKFIPAGPSLVAAVQKINPSVSEQVSEKKETIIKTASNRSKGKKENDISSALKGLADHPLASKKPNTFVDLKKEASSDAENTTSEKALKAPEKEQAAPTKDSVTKNLGKKANEVAKNIDNKKEIFKTTSSTIEKTATTNAAQNVAATNQSKDSSIDKNADEQETRESTLNTPLLKTPKVATKDASIPPAPFKAISQALEQGIYIEQAGLVLVAPFLPTFFTKLGYVKNRKFIDEATQERATLLLYYLATGETTVDEQQVLLPKIITGMPLHESLPNVLDLSTEEIKESESLLSSVIAHWNALGSSGIDALRETFLSREGKIIVRDEKMKLIISRKTVDILLDKISWSFSMIKLPWMEKTLNVVW